MAYTTAVGNFNSPTVTTTNSMGETVIGYSPYGKDSKYKVTGTDYTGKVLYTNDTGYANGVNASKTASSNSATSGNASGSTIGASSAALSAYNDAISTAKNGLSQVSSIVSNVNNAASNARSDLSSAREVAGQIGGYANSMTSIADTLSPYANYLTGVGTGIVGTGQGMGTYGSAVMSGDPSVGGIVGDLITQVANIDPDKYVSSAAQDVQSTYDSQYGSLMRNISRSGASPSSGNMMALQQQYAQSLATAKAAAMTRARQTGITEKLSATKDLAEFGKSLTESSVAMQNTGANIVDAAGNIISSQANIYGTAGNLLATQGGLYANIGGVETSIGNLELSGASAIQNAVNSVTSAQEALGEYYKAIDTATIGANTTTTTTESEGLLGNLFPELYGKTTTSVKTIS